MSRVVAVIVHWQDPADTLGCVESLAGDPGVEIIVVDNGSREPCGALLADRAPAVVCIRNPENLGYAGGANVGIRAALARGADVVLLLNNDVRLQPGAVAAALRVLDGDPRVAIVGAKVLTREDPSRLWLAWGRVTWGQSLVALEGADAPDGPRFSRERDVEWIGGCTMWMRAEALGRIGLLDEAFFAYHEEVDWCVRARALGYRVVYCPDAIVTHTGRGTAGGRRSVRIRKYFGARNTILFARKHAGPREWSRLVASLMISLPLQVAWHGLRGRPGEAWVKVEGIRDALAGREPPFDRLGLR
ncbi:MAG TPA: glycosyltransferase family 2 protein [Candidatus Binatia bacterium]|jgi:GT2 family glycosyltransferase|nr:glycosyltransferase family 2 protein [Candidatus Binatia bacterium]